ncbi:hypothetical protein [Flavobacterium sp.]|uniref:hypothetical protein n=1 Tax=Flavobacterium sp. TaxID=239 RepID=UPI0037AE118F
MKKGIQRISLLVIILFMVCGCAGTINTVKSSEQNFTNFKKAYIISTDNSQYIRFKFGIITPFAYIIPSDDPAAKHDIIGTTAEVIKKELEKNGIIAEIGKKEDTPEGFDFIVQYYDTWRWDFKKILDKLEIVFITPEGNKVIAKSTYNIYKNKELHNFPTPEKEVPQMIKELLSK